MNPAIPIAAAITASPTPPISHQIDVVAAVIAAEARSEGWCGMAAVAQSIRNRGGNPFAQVTRWGQYVVLNWTTPERLVARMRKEDGFYSARQLARWLVLGAENPFGPVMINGATHFHDTSIQTPKGWGKCLAKVGTLRFYKQK